MASSSFVAKRDVEALIDVVTHQVVLRKEQVVMRIESVGLLKGDKLRDLGDDAASALPGGGKSHLVPAVMLAGHASAVGTGHAP